MTKLIPPLLASVDEGKLPVSNAADFISVLTEQEQADLATAMDKLDVVPAKGQLAKIKECSNADFNTPKQEAYARWTEYAKERAPGVAVEDHSAQFFAH